MFVWSALTHGVRAVEAIVCDECLFRYDTGSWKTSIDFFPRGNSASARHTCTCFWMCEFRQHRQAYDTVELARALEKWCDESVGFELCG